MRLFTGILSLGVTALGAQAAFAADAITSYEPPAAAPYVEAAPLDWNGAYVGGTIGYGFENQTEVRASDAAGQFSKRYMKDDDGINGGVFGGYNYQMGNVVVGGEADVELTDAKGERETFGGGAITSSDQTVQGSLRARAGYSMGPALVYGTGGLAISDAEYKAADASGAGIDDSAKFGYTVGGGVDVKATDNVFVRGEYRFTDYGKDEVSTPAATYEFDNKSHIVKAGVGYKF